MVGRAACWGHGTNEGARGISSWSSLRLEFGAKWPMSLDFGGLFQKDSSLGSVLFPSEPGDVTSRPRLRFNTAGALWQAVAVSVFNKPRDTAIRKFCACERYH